MMRPLMAMAIRGVRRLGSARKVVWPALLLAVLTVVGAGSAESRGGVVDPPNVLVIVTDDQRDQTVRFLPATKRLFVREGRNYSNAYVATPLCCPSRASIYSGRYPHNHGVQSNDPEDWLSVFDSSKTLAPELGAAGYATAHFGKYLNRWDDKVQGSAGFQTADTTISRNRPEKTELRLADRAERYIQRREDADTQPWFLVLSTNAAHSPLEPLLRRFREMSVPQMPTTPAYKEKNISDKSRWTRRQIRQRSGRSATMPPRKYWRRSIRMLYGADEMNRRVFAALEEHGEDENTLAIFISDNGLMLGDHRMVGKIMPQQVDLKVPLMLRWPAQIPPGADPRLALNVDLAPTIYAAAGIDPGYEVDGYDLRGTHDREWVLAEDLDKGWGSVLNLSEHYIDISKTSEEEYYDLTLDPFELRNRPGEEARKAELKALVDVYDECRGLDCP